MKKQSFKTIKIDKTDTEFSIYVRLRDGKCMRCFKPGTGKRGIEGLQNSHFFSRKNENTRFDTQNCDALCPGCHQYFSSNPEAYRNFKLKQLGEVAYNMLTIRAHTYKRKDRKMSLICVREMLRSLKNPLANELPF